nr:hypothetical protein C4D60_Mb02t03040 [Ipomoea batatas]
MTRLRPLTYLDSSLASIGVATPNGDTQFTLTPYLPNSTPKFFAKPTTACFDAEYSCGTWPCVTEATLEVKITLPFLAGIMTRAACFAHRKAPNTLASNTCLKLSWLELRIDSPPFPETPALLNMMSSFLCLDTAAFTAFSTSASRLTSQCT